MSQEPKEDQVNFLIRGMDCWQKIILHAEKGLKMIFGIVQIGYGPFPSFGGDRSVE